MAGRILVTGARGNVGSEVIAALLRRGHDAEIVAATSHPEQAQTRNEQLQYVHLDFTDPTTFVPALHGIEKVFLVRPPQLSDVSHSITPFIQAAKTTGVRQVVFLSLLGVETNRVVPHARIEHALHKAEIPWTMLRPSFFMQNLSTTHRDEIRDGNEIFVPAGQGRTSFVDVRDIADVAGKVLTETGHTYKSYDLTGSEALSYNEVANTMTEVVGRRIVYRNPSLLAFLARWKARGKPTDFVLIMAGIYLTARLGLAARLADDITTLLRRPPTTLRQFVADYQAVWNM